MTAIHANLPRIFFPDDGILETRAPWTERKSRFTVRFEMISIGMLQNMDTYNFTDITKLSWKQAWSILEKAARGGQEEEFFINN